jgi:hypothetical protein
MRGDGISPANGLGSTSGNVDEKDLQSIAFGRVVTHRTGNPAHGAVDSGYAACALT